MNAEQADKLLDGLTVDTSRQERPILLDGTGRPLKTWRENHPYGRKVGRTAYERRKRVLQIELLKLQRWVRDTGARVIVVCEGRDAAGKGGTIQRLTERLNPRGARVVALDRPTERETGQWYFQRYIAHLPTAGEIVFFDRSWYNRAGVERVMGYCSKDQYELFLEQCPAFERMLVDDGILLVKFWFSVSRAEQRTRFAIRQVDPVRQWKLSPPTWPRWTGGTTTRRPRSTCSGPPTPKARPGPSSRATTNVAPGWRPCAVCCRASTTPARIPRRSVPPTRSSSAPPTPSWSPGRRTPPFRRLLCPTAPAGPAATLNPPDGRLSHSFGCTVLPPARSRSSSGRRNDRRRRSRWGPSCTSRRRGT